MGRFNKVFEDRIGYKPLRDKIIDSKEAVNMIKDGMVVGLSGFTRAGEAKVVPLALVDHIKQTNESLKVDIYTGASLGNDIDGKMAEAGLIRKRLPFQADRTMRKNINEGNLYFVDAHLSLMSEQIRNGGLKSVDVAIIEAIAITEEGHIVPSTSVGNSAIFVEKAKEVIVELNASQPIAFKGMHDIYMPSEQGNRQPIPLVKADDRIGTTAIPVDPNKIKGIVISEIPDTPSEIVPPDEETQIMANHLLSFLREEVKKGNLPKNLLPLQSGIGSIANAVLHGFIDSEFEDLEVYSEVLQDSVFDLLDSGKAKFASGCAITLSPETMERVFNGLEEYKDRVILRPQEMSNHPEIIRRLGIIAINTALEVDIYGNVNSTHVLGSKMMNGIGGSGDFARNARLAIFATKSIAKNGDITSIVPFVSHVDHNEHDVDVIVTEQGYADLRGLAPRERAELIIEKCVHPTYKPLLREYYEEAVKSGGHTPHVMEKAFSFHTRFEEEGTMLTETKSISKKHAI